MSTCSNLILGVDVGSTTVKTVLVDPQTQCILWSDYQRHETKQAEKVMEQLKAVSAVFPHISRIFMTGSGAEPLTQPLGAKFVQEVNAVTMAVDQLHPEAGSVIELGGQDAKIIIYKASGPNGPKRAIASMNDKCASGTGATIDKCLVKLGLDPREICSMAWDDSKLHPVAAKCGVFAETDIVNLVKSGIPSREILCSLANAIVMQNLSVLTRGNTLLHSVVLLGGPNTHLHFLQDCWRQRILETWKERGHTFPNDDVSKLIFVPPNSDLYAAFGAAIYGMHEPDHIGAYRGTEDLEKFILHGRAARLGASAGPPLVRDADELTAFAKKYRIPPFKAATFESGKIVRGYIGLDGGSTSSKAVLVDENGDILCKQYMLSKGNPIADTKELLSLLKNDFAQQGCTLEVLGFGATGYAADVLEESLAADANIVETVAHGMASTRFFNNVDVICDIGGQDIKVLFVTHGQISSFRLSNQCSAGNGMLLQAMAAQFGVPVKEYADVAFAAKLSPKFSYGCAVFLDTDRVTFQKEGFSREELLAGLALVLPKNVWQYVAQVPRMSALGRTFVLQGGTQYNLAAVKAQHDYIKERVPDAVIHVHPHPGEAGALGAALEARRMVLQRGKSTFIGLDAAIDLSFTSRNDTDTICHFCPNHCKRTFIDTKAASGRTSRYISGFSCENGTVESKQKLKELAQRRKLLKAKYPNLVDYESKLAFQSFYKPTPLPEAGAKLTRDETRRNWLGTPKAVRVTRRMQRSSDDDLAHRQNIRIGIPRVLNLYSTAPLWRVFFETLGIPSANIVFSDATTPEMWAEGSKYGSIDPCHPSKVTQAHIHSLLHHKSRERQLNYIFFPCITHLPTFVSGVMDSTSCPIVAGAPKVIRAAFTKEVDFFERAGVEYVDAAVTLTEPNYLVKQLYEAWGKKLRITHDECEFAVQQGFEALKRFDVEMQRKGSEVLAQLEDENRAGLLLLGRPYHNDPGLNHGVLDEFQALGYPILSIRSIPKEPEWLERFFDDDLRRGMVDSPLSVADVWPENYSANSVQKVWAAKLAARHPNLVVLDLSSFKCGHDAPTYGLIDHILSATATPAMNLHDIDANKPSGSILIRVKTYAHTLKLHEEKLKQEAANRNELQKRVAEKRRELLALQRAQLDRDADLQLMNEAYQAYLDADVTIELPDRDFTFEAMGDTQAHSGHQTALALVNGHRFVIEERTNLQPIQAGQQIALDSTLLSSLNRLDTNSKKSQQITCSSCTPHSCPTCDQ